jgi:hypothetical protein
MRANLSTDGYVRTSSAAFARSTPIATVREASQNTS